MLQKVKRKKKVILLKLLFIFHPGVTLYEVDIWHQWMTHKTRNKS